MKRKTLLLFVMMFVLVFISACGDTETEQTSSKENDDTEVEEKNVEKEKAEKEDKEENKEESKEEEVEEDPIPEEYAELMELFETAISEEWELEKLLEYEIGYMMENPGSLPKDYGYYFKDLNYSGTEEMIVGYEIKLEDGEIHKEIGEIYTIVDGEPVRVFVGALRHGADVFSDGTIHEYYLNPGSGEQFAEYYHLKEDGTKDMKDEYFYDAATDTYKPSADSNEELSEADVEKITEKYGEPEDITYTPFLQVEATEGRVSEEEAKEIKEKVYDQLRDTLAAHTFDNSLEEYLTYENVEDMWQNGVDRDSDFYKAAFDAHYDEAKHIVTEAGMKSYIEAKIHYRDYGPAPSTFIPDDKGLDIVEQNDNQLKLEQVIEIGPQDVGGESYDIVYQITFAKEDAKWKLEDIEEIDNPGKV